MPTTPAIAPGRQRRPDRSRRARRSVLALAVLGAIALLAGACTPSITAGNVLQPGDQLVASNGYHADMQTNGQLVIIKPDGTSGWHTQTANHPGAYLSVQTDGNMVLYDTDGTPLFQTNTASIDTVPSSLEMQTDGNLVLSAAGQRMWSSAFGADSCYGSGCQVLSNFESHQGGTTSRDCGYSAPFGDGTQSFWLFCDTVARAADGTNVSAYGSSYAYGRSHANFAPQNLTDPPSGVPEKLLPQPTGLTRLDGTPCGSPGSYAASWATGLSAIPGTTDELLIPFGNYCVESGGVMTYFGSGIAEYNTTTKQLYYQENLMTGSNYLHGLGTPTYDPATNALYFFGSHCTSSGFGVCTESTGFTARVDLGSDPLTTRPWRTDTNYLYFKGGTTWSPGSAGAAPILPTDTGNMSVSVQRVPSLGNQWVMFGDHHLAGGYTIFTAPSPTGPWTQHSAGDLPDCANEPSGYCYAFNVHAELSTADKLAVTVYNPKYSNVTLEMIPW